MKFNHYELDSSIENIPHSDVAGSPFNAVAYRPSKEISLSRALNAIFLVDMITK